jgi:hypothetical protein
MPYFTRLTRMNCVRFEPTTSAMPTRIFYVAGGDSPDDGDGSKVLIMVHH